MVTSCFFCQNLLSDYIEGILPSSRQDELKSHLGECRECGEVHKDLVSTLDLLHSLPARPLSHDMSLRITEASQAGKASLFTRVRVSRVLTFLAVPILIFATAVFTFPTLFPWVYRLGRPSDEGSFVRFYPLLQGAAEIIEEQSNWLHLREPFMRSLWEEGGLSPEEFEKSFQGKSSGGAEKVLPTEGAKDEE